MENRDCLGHFQRIADSMTQGLIHGGDGSNRMQACQASNINHRLRKATRLLYRLHKRA